MKFKPALDQTWMATIGDTNFFNLCMDSCRLVILSGTAQVALLAFEVHLEALEQFAK